MRGDERCSNSIGSENRHPLFRVMPMAAASGRAGRWRQTRPGFARSRPGNCGWRRGCAVRAGRPGCRHRSRGAPGVAAARSAPRSWLAFLARPTLHQRGRRHAAGRRDAPRQRIGLRRVVFHDHMKIPGSSKKAGRVLRCWQEQKSTVGQARETPGPPARLMPRSCHWRSVICRERSAQEIVEVRRHRDLVTPCLPAHPAVALEIVGGGGDHVGNRVDHVAPPVMVEIDRVAPRTRSA